MRNRVLGTNMLATVATVLLIVGTAIGRQVPNADSTNPVKRFRWPNGRRAAVSLSFDDARVSQIDTGLALLKRQLVKVTFFVQAEQVRKRLDGKRRSLTVTRLAITRTLTLALQTIASHGSTRSKTTRSK